MAKDKRLTIRLSEELYDALARCAEKNDISVSYVIRAAVGHFLGTAPGLKWFELPSKKG